MNLFISLKIVTVRFFNSKARKYFIVYNFIDSSIVLLIDKLSFVFINFIVLFLLLSMAKRICVDC